MHVYFGLSDKALRVVHLDNRITKQGEKQLQLKPQMLKNQV